jgi:hypothetical protein
VQLENISLNLYLLRNGTGQERNADIKIISFCFISSFNLLELLSLLIDYLLRNLTRDAILSSLDISHYLIAVLYQT